MHFNPFVTAVSAIASIMTLTNAAPFGVSERSIICPPGTSYYSAGSCNSGFVGCATLAQYSSACPGARRFYNDCGPNGDLGSYYNCANGFKGCTTDSNVCNPATPQTTPPAPGAKNTPTTPTKPSNPSPPTTGRCPSGTWYVSENGCASGFIGCTANSGAVCPGPKRFWGSCPTGHGNYYVCANGFKGCTTDTSVCN
ncbi:hypothetical protein H2199_000252 [Coniosporium tulheliwenetii]|uniref:Uncharacterized protein n=1 Tax=Coniosporium tulheliwenetii TaxID=3383036 RepID=A0ACC2ZPI8_9PEZI|nr:hypothetical protein H2199_000252 [Cladosporium sp. JES 115]